MLAVKVLLAQDAFLGEAQVAVELDGACVEGEDLATELVKPEVTKA